MVSKFISNILTRMSIFTPKCIGLFDQPKDFFVDGKLNKSSINRHVKFPVFYVNCNHIQSLMRLMKAYLPELTQFNCIIPGEKKKGILFDPYKLDKIKDDVKLNESFTKMEIKFDVNKLEEVIRELTYDNYRSNELMKWLMPTDNYITSYTQTGHIIHLNLRKEHETYKWAIGEILLDKIPTAKSVVNKINCIENEFRVLNFELLAGENNYVTTISEENYKFALDFSKVYWNSRLSTEHRRIYSKIKSSDVVYDACAGIGPFIIPAAKLGAQCVANDLNFESVKWLRHNIQLNSSKRKPISMDVHNLDANQFIRDIMIPDIYQRLKGDMQPNRFYLIMNLPAKAIQFLPSIIDQSNIHLMELQKQDYQHMIVLHVKCYCFIGRTAESRTMIDQTINQSLPAPYLIGYDVRRVRDVSTSKDMYCLELDINLTPSVENNIETTDSLCNQQEPPQKRQKHIGAL